VAVRCTAWPAGAPDPTDAGREQAPTANAATPVANA